MGGARTSKDGLGAEPGKTRRDDYRPFFIGVFGKRLELLKEVRPQATTFGYLLNATNPANQFRRPVDDAARSLGLKLEIVEVKEMRACCCD
jgi:hypothetical protein